MPKPTKAHLRKKQAETDARSRRDGLAKLLYREGRTHPYVQITLNESSKATLDRWKKAAPIDDPLTAPAAPLESTDGSALAADPPLKIGRDLEPWDPPLASDGSIDLDQGLVQVAGRLLSRLVDTDRLLQESLSAMTARAERGIPPSGADLSAIAAIIASIRHLIADARKSTDVRPEHSADHTEITIQQVVNVFRDIPLDLIRNAPLDQIGAGELTSDPDQRSGTPPVDVVVLAPPIE